MASRTNSSFKNLFFIHAVVFTTLLLIPHIAASGCGCQAMFNCSPVGPVFTTPGNSAAYCQSGTFPVNGCGGGAGQICWWDGAR
ncbi:MAG TPA: hypothetical protein VM432_08440 [Bdellovibrionales bacterium]|nr:hypothetical protein [Bdellovibrionales bacterium]